MSDQRGSIFVSDLPDTRQPAQTRAPDAPVTGGEILGAHWTLGRQDFAGAANQAEMDAYSPIVAELAKREPRGWFGVEKNYFGAYRSSHPYNYGLIWDDVAKYRAADPSFMKDIPAKDAEEFAAYVKAQELKERRGAQDVVSRQSGLGQNALGFAADLGTGFADPINLSTMVLTGGISGAAKTLPQIMAREALINSTIEATQLPGIAANRAAFGEDMSTTEGAQMVGMAALGGAAFPGITHAIGAGGKAIGRKLTGSDSEVAAAFAEAVPAEIRSPDERAALHVIQRQADVDATNPFRDTPTGRDAHADRLDAALSAILRAGDPDGAGPTPSVRSRLGSSSALSSGVVPMPGAPVAVPRETFTVPRESGRALFKRMAGPVENSTGNPNARNPGSSATGKYQFIDRTWLQYYKREIGANGLSDAQILARRSDGKTQDRLFDALTADNAAHLARIGQPETAGNLYLEHFAGQRGAEKIFAADPQARIETILSADAIEANKFLKGKTARDVIAWAHRKMGEEPHAGPVLRREAFDSDGAFAAAQRAIDESDAEMAAMAREGAAADEAAPVTIDPVGAIDPAVEVKGADWEPLAEPVTVPRETPGVPRASAAERDSMGVTDPTAPYGSRANPSEADRARLAYPPVLDQADATRRLQQRIDRIASNLAGQGNPYRGLDYTDRVLLNEAFQSDVSLVAKDGKPRDAATIAQEFADRDIATSVVSDEEIGHVLGRQDLIDAAARDREPVFQEEFLQALADYRAEHGADAMPSTSELHDRALARRMSPADPHGSMPLFDRPTDPGAIAQIDSIAHDLRIEAEADPDATYRLGDDGEERPLAEILAELDAEDAALETVKACLI